MKQITTLFISVIIFFLMIDNNFIMNNINKYIERNYYKHNYEKYLIATNTDILKNNKYFKKPITNYVNVTDNFYPKNKQELLNVYYTILNNGWNEFSFYCDKSYKTCLEDIELISNENTDFSNINQLLNPYNSFSSITSNYINGRIDVKVENKYTDEQIEAINNKIYDIIDKLNINDQKNVKEKIRLFHDYIANNNVYDKEKELGNSIYHSDTAIGTLFEGHSICSGYTDTMSLFLDKINLENYKISNQNHTWNIVKIKDKWYHIDLTWNDPITNTGENIIQYDYFLISTNELRQKSEFEHSFDENIFNFLN